jgi:hypothetical protein
MQADVLLRWVFGAGRPQLPRVHSGGVLLRYLCVR